MLSFYFILSTLVLGYVGTYIWALYYNWFVSRKTGFPNILVPVDQNHIFWVISAPALRSWYERHLPKALYERIVLDIYGWEFHQKFSGPQTKYKSYMLIGFGRPELSTSDSEVAAQIVNRPKDFVQLDFANRILNQFGDNCLASDGDHWARQRKVVANVINERISATVFKESVRQTEQMLLEAESKANEQGITDTNSLFDWARRITIHVLSAAGMGAPIPWDDNSGEKPKPGCQQTYIEATKSVINAMMGTILIPGWILNNYPTFLPGYATMRGLGIAKKEFPVYMADMLEAERQRSKAEGGVAKHNILSQLLQASDNPVDVDQKTDAQHSRGSQALTEGELIGNLFIVSVAGFETSATSISYAFTLLARHPEWQDWLFEETDQILPSDSDTPLDYVAVFPKATRTVAFLLETLRLFPPLVHLSKQTRYEQTIETSEGSYWLPANTTIFINLVALHLDPKVWANLNLHDGEKPTTDDAAKFRPSRWINVPATPQPHYMPVKGTYLPWSTGPRVCPGQKMAQVEFVAIFLTILRRHRIDAAPIGNESRADVDRRLDARIKDSISILTLQMRDVYDVAESDPAGLRLRISKRN